MSQYQPFFSIIVPSFNRPERLTKCLRALSRVDYPGDRLEVIVVDDGGEKSPESVVASFEGRLELTLISQPNSGPAAARTRGAAHARGEFLAFTDDDCEPADNWLQTLAVRFEKDPTCAIGGRTVNGLPKNLYSSASQLLIDYLYAYHNDNPNRARFLASNNLALPADRFHDVGGFDASFYRAAGEDREFCDRWIHRGYRMIYAPEVLVFHAHSLTLRTFLRQQFNYGMGAFLFHRKSSCRPHGYAYFQEPPSFYANLLRYPFSTAQAQKRLILAMLFLLSQLGIAAGYFRGRLEWNETA